MQLTGNRALPATVDQAWQALNDPAVLRACIPGCDRFDAVDGDAYDVGMQLKIGPVSARFSGRVVLSEREPGRGYRLAFEGQGGAAGFGKGTSTVRLTPTAEGCELQYDVSASVGGRLAQLGQRLIDVAARQVADDFFKRFEVQIRAIAEAGAGAARPMVVTVPPPARRVWSRWWWALPAGLTLVLLVLI
jgi:carbon monoxide dehydrogenase subunit G